VQIVAIASGGKPGRLRHLSSVYTILAGEEGYEGRGVTCKIMAKALYQYR